MSRQHTNTERSLGQYHEDVRFLESLSNSATTSFTAFHEKRIAPGHALRRVRVLLKLLGNPERGLKVIHIAGTSGKGTVTKLIEALLDVSGKRSGSYTSPFATTNVEKFSANGALMTATELHELLEKEIKPALDRLLREEKGPIPSYFELCFALALCFFRKKRCAWAILEAGLGGTYDATNVIERPVAGAITSIGLDHTHILGKTKRAIAADKADIIKPGMFFLTAETAPELVTLFRDRCKKVGATFVECHGHQKIPKEETLGDPISKSFLVEINAENRYFSTRPQQNNLNLALNILNALKIEVTPNHLNRVLKNFHLPARQEIVQRNPIVVLDGAHNDDKLSNLAEFLKTIPHQKLHLLFGIAEDKRYDRGLKDLLVSTDHLYITRFLAPFRKTEDPRHIAKHARKYYRGKLELFFDPWQALDAALKNAETNDLIVVTGSFFLAGELRTRWVSEKTIVDSASIS